VKGPMCLAVADDMLGGRRTESLFKTGKECAIHSARPWDVSPTAGAKKEARGGAVIRSQDSGMTSRAFTSRGTFHVGETFEARGGRCTSQRERQVLEGGPRPDVAGHGRAEASMGDDLQPTRGVGTDRKAAVNARPAPRRTASARIPSVSGHTSPTISVARSIILIYK
jgi:hypothetical protein